MVEGKTIKVDVTTSEGKHFSVETWLSEIPYAKLHATRHTFKNYRAFVNPGKESIKTIFHALPFEGEFKEMTSSAPRPLTTLTLSPVAVVAT